MFHQAPSSKYWHRLLWLQTIRRFQRWHSSTTFYIHQISCDIRHQIRGSRRFKSLVEGQNLFSIFLKLIFCHRYDHNNSVSLLTEPSDAYHNSDVIMGMMGSQITWVLIIYSAVCSGTDQRKHQTSSSLAFVRGIHRSPGPATRKRFPFDDVIMYT